MTQSASPSQITLSAMRDLFVQKFPDRVKPFDQVKPDLEAGKGTQALANLIGCEVEVRDDQGFSTYRWTGKSGPFEMKVPKPFDPAPQRPSEPQQQVRSEEPGTPQDASQSAPESSSASEAQDATPELPEADSDSQNATEEVAEPEPAPAAVAKGLFAALAALLGDSTLLMTVAKTDVQEDEPLLTVTVVPQGEEAFTPVCLTGSASELDTHFVPALESKAESKKSLAEQVEALKAADKALEEAKKQEVAAKNKQTEQKNKATEKKEEQAKAEERKVEAKAEAEKQQEALF